MYFLFYILICYLFLLLNFLCFSSIYFYISNTTILAATDGSDFEIPNTVATRQNYNSTKNNTSVARAHISNTFDVLNHYVLSTVIGSENADEKEMDRKNLKEIKDMNFFTISLNSTISIFELNPFLFKL